jgi:DNA repair photolyase
MQTHHNAQALRGRAAPSNQTGRFETHKRSIMDDGWDTLAQRPARKPTTLHIDNAKAVLTRNQSPDVPFEQSVNAYRGCEHGCIYCFARPSHSYMGLSAGQDFETEIFMKPNAAALLEREITRPGYKMRTIAMGTNTDPYQPAEKTQRITRALLEVLQRHQHPVSITTKSHLVTRDTDILSAMAADGLARVEISITTLNHRLSRQMEPRAASPARRLDAVRALSQAGIPCGVMVAPVIPALTDHEMDWILAAAKDAGAQSAGWIMLRLPGEVAGLFEQWLQTAQPERKNRVLAALRDMRGGKLNDPRFGERMRGHGPWAALIGQRFYKAAKRNGLSIKSMKAQAALPHTADLVSALKPRHEPTRKRPKRAPAAQKMQPHEQQLSLF